jgi:aminopeptidase-like protein
MTGDGNRQTLEVLRKSIPLTICEVPSGTQVFDWTVPKEWNIRAAFINDPEGKRVVDLKTNNLQVVGYSIPVHQMIALAELKKHIFTLPDRPEWIPYRTSYFKESWGFCMSHRQMQALVDGQYEILIDSTISEGHLTYGELFIKGATSEEVLISTHICHPSLCNDNLSGIALATLLAKTLATMSLKYSYRFLFVPATIGSITWLARNEHIVPRIRHGLVLAGVGDRGTTTYKKTRRGDSEIDRAALHVLKHSGEDFNVVDFIPYGYDERQFCSPGFNLPVGCFMRSQPDRYPEYHTSADNLSFVQPAFLANSFRKCLSLLSVLDRNAVYINQNPKCEPQLGRRGIFRSYSDRTDGAHQEMALLWVLNLSDGTYSLLDIAERSGLPFDAIWNAAAALLKHDLLKERLCHERI